jgi:DNA-binding MarR family transcriptional regulator
MKRSRIQPGEPLELLGLLWAVHHRLQAISKKMQATRGLTGQQRALIKLIGRHPGITAGELARARGLHPSTLTASFHALEKGRFIERTVHEDDARRACFRLTAKGDADDRSLPGTAEAALLRMLARTDRAEWGKARDWLKDLIREMDTELDGYDG